jgi:hypothetical protein
MGIGGVPGAVVTVLVVPVDIPESAMVPGAAWAMVAPTIPRVTMAPPAMAANVLVLLDVFMWTLLLSKKFTSPSTLWTKRRFDLFRYLRKSSAVIQATPSHQAL